MAELDLLRPLRSVRVRITLAATVVTAVAVVVAGMLLVRAVKDTQLGRVRNVIEARLDNVANELESGVSPQEAVRQPEPFGLVQVVDVNGGLLAASPAVSVDGYVVFIGEGGGVAGQPPIGGERFQMPIDASAAGARAEQLEVLEREVETEFGTVKVLAAAPIDEIERGVAAVRRALWVALPFLVALVAGVAWVLVGRSLRPVEAMRTEAEAITASTMYRRVPEPDTDDEVGRLARTMNAMLERLERSATRQRQFVSDASHELRSPVAGIRTDLEVALREGARADWPKVASAVLAEEARLEGLLDDLLLLASGDEGATMPLTIPTDLAAIARDEAARPRAAPVTVEADGSTMVDGVPDQLRRAVANLLDNAARHATSAVQATVSLEGVRVRLTVDDDGPGIAPQERERVFERFTRLDDGRARDHGGAGLGLAVVRSIVTRHRGRVWVEDAPSALDGARFVVELPSPTRPGGG